MGYFSKYFKIYGIPQGPPSMASTLSLENIEIDRVISETVL